MTIRRALRLGILLVAAGCATPRPTLRGKPARPRLNDTPAEKLAAMPVPDPAADPENKDRRYGVESARARDDEARRRREEERHCLEVISRREAARDRPPCTPPTTR